MSRRLFLSALACAAAGPEGARAQPRPTTPSYALFDAAPATHRLSRHDLTLGDRPYRVFRAIPAGMPPAGGWPSIWMLDGNAVFNRLAPAALARHPGLAVIGIGTPTPLEFDSAARTLDYTPASAGPSADPRQPGRATGGDAAFRARLIGPLRALTEEGAALDPGARTLWGHSYGGLFTLATLFETPDAFRRYAPVSPSVGYGGSALLRLEAAAAPVTKPPAEVLLMLGDAEARDAAAPRGPAPGTMALAARLARRPDLTVATEVFPGLSHGATLAASLAPALAFAARP